MRRAIIALAALASCCSPQQPSGPASAHKSSVALTAAERAVVVRRCQPCHLGQQAPAGVVLDDPSAIASHVLPLWAAAVRDGRAPAFSVLDPWERILVEAPARRAGVVFDPMPEPAAFRWSMNEALADVADGAPASAHGIGFGMVAEDLYRDGTDGASEWTVVRYPNAGRAVRLFRTHAPAGVLPSSYWAPVVPYHGIVDATATGWIKHGRWTSVVLGVRDLAGPGRGRRQYVRFTIDRDTASLRSVPTDQEAWPYYQDPDHALVGGPTSERFAFLLPSSERIAFRRYCVPRTRMARVRRASL